MEGPLKAEASIGTAVASIAKWDGRSIDVEVEGRRCNVATILSEDGGQPELLGANICGARRVEHDRGVGRALQQVTTGAVISTTVRTWVQVASAVFPQWSVLTA